MNYLEKKILDIIEKRYKKKYVGGIKVTKLLTGYKLEMRFDNQDVGGLVISADIDNDEDFLKFIEKELVSRLLHRTQWFRGIKIYPEDEQGRTYR